MLIITGTQRSGTSVIAKCLVESNYILGGADWDEEVQGGYENEHICAFYRGYLGDPRFPFDDYPWPPLDASNFSKLDFHVAKFSYLLMNPAFVTIWHKFRPAGDTFLVMYRYMTDVVASKDRVPERFKHDSTLLDQEVLQLNANFLHSVEVLAEFYKVRSLRFPDCLTDLQWVNVQLAALDPNVQIHPAAWDRVVDLEKVHFK